MKPFLDLRHLDASAGHEISLVKQFLVILTRCIEIDVINNSIFDLFDGPNLQQTISFILILPGVDLDKSAWHPQKCFMLSLMVFVASGGYSVSDTLVMTHEPDRFVENSSMGIS